ncbi:MAG: hypothetical protein AMJ42_04485 [Deltaproteobacteria bacterium DG_8]|nr:MAG: hypothetical protein AMJ42_04485 [Deltaproteobacteria bacterium DG_8]
MKRINRILTHLIACGFILMGFIIEGGYAEEWEKVNSKGFGNIDNKSSFPMEIFNNDLYVGTWNDAGTEIWMTPEGTNCDWNLLNVNGFGSPENSHSTSTQVFNDELYIGVFNEGGGEIWLTGDGTSWDQVKIASFSPSNRCVRAMSTFDPYGSNQLLFIGTDNEEGTQVWMTSNGIDWLLMEDSGFGDENNTSFYCMAVFNYYLYLGTVNQQSGTQIWRTKGGITWTKVNIDGFGYSGNHASYSMCNFKGYLYVGTANHLSGTQVWRTSDGVTWYQSNDDGFGDPSNFCSYCMAVFDDRLYVGTGNMVARVWRTEDGVIWEQVNIDGFGDIDNRWVHSLIVFDDYLYAGTGNERGTEIWRCEAPEEGINPCFLETVFEDEPQRLHTLRKIRDAMLSRDLEASDYIELYYHYSSELREIYSSYPGVRRKTREILKYLIPRIILISEGDEKGLGFSMTGELLSLLEEYAQVASPGLRSVIKKIKEELKNGSLSNLLRFGETRTVEEGINY